MPSAIQFRKTLHTTLMGAKLQNMPFIDVSAGDLHRLVGGYPGRNHNMPSCCEVMRHEMGPKDVILNEPPKGKGASFTIRYHIASR